jgi:quercetin dioxygenase-like cupin family protein
MAVIRHADSRRTEIPSGVLSTLASPTQGGATMSVWRVDMGPGSAGPPHAFDTEQVWTVLEGGATVELGGATLMVEPGDTLVMPADVPRRVIADLAAGFAAIAIAPAGTRAYSLDDSLVVSPHCAVPDGDKLIPAWVV